VARTLLDLAKSMERRAAALPAGPNALAIDVARAILADFGRISPVDTSLFVSNWQVTLDGKPMTYRPAYFYGELGSTRGASVGAMLADGEAVLATKKPGQRIYISNVLPYAHVLDTGHAKQGPIGFRARAALIGRKMVAKNG